MDASSHRRWRYDWTFVILCIVAIFLSGVTATLVVINKNGYSSSTPIRVQSGPVILAQQDGVDGGVRVSQVSLQQTEARALLSERSQTTRVAVASHHSPKPKAYRPYVVKSGEMLSRLDPEGWKHTCEINRQFGSIKKMDCTLKADVAILLPVAVVESLAVAAADTTPTMLSQIAKAEPETISLDQQIRLAGIVRQQFCDHPGNERSSACEPERAAAFEMLVLSLHRSLDRT